MSEDTRTKKEIEADVALTVAEASQTKAAEDKLRAETSKIELQAALVQLDVQYRELELNSKQMAHDKDVERHKKDKAVDEENFLYRFSGEVSGGSVNKCMSKLTEWHRIAPKSDIEIVFSSPGGSIIDGMELFDFIQHLRNSGHHVTTGSLGMAASMAGILLQAGDTRWLGHQAWMMIHRAAFGAYGKTFEVEDEVKLVKRMEDRILTIFTARSKLTSNKIKRNWDRKDWWISADECKEMGLIDEIRAIMPEQKKRKRKK
tara:strand:- start:311 stop:1090 length:780 start_codon:yes stop_codon:yes gene_type:complete